MSKINTNKKIYDILTITKEKNCKNPYFIRLFSTYIFVSNNDSLDWQDLTASEITKRVTERLAPGSITLFHNAAKNTPEALPQILDKVKAEGYTLVPISELIYRDDFEVDHSGKQISKAQ